MRRHRLFTALAVLTLTAMAAPGCLDLLMQDPLEGPPFLGEWIATSYVLVNANDTSQEIDLIGEQYWFEYLIFEDGGYHRVTERIPGEPEYVDTGDWTLHGDTMTITYDVIPETIDWLWHMDPQGRLVFEIDSEEGWDFDGDDADEPTHETITLVNADGNPDEVVVGEWTASGYTYVSDDSSASTDLIAEGGSLNLTLSHQGSYQYAEDLPGSARDEGSGEYAAVEGLVWIMSSPSEIELFRYGIDADDLLLRTDDAAWDFDGDGTDDPADLVIRLTPQ